MNAFDLSAIIRLDTNQYEEDLGRAEGRLDSFGKTMSKSLKVLSTAVAVSSAAVAGATIKLASDAIASYGDYEQLIGGVETLFKDSADIVSAYADNAYKTAGLSANEYMQTVTGFSASLLQSLGGDTAKAAEYADMAITDMSDNANKMGTSMEAVQNAYSGFARGNFMMLDNLKLGYAGTRTEMERLIKDAENLDSSFTATRDANGDLAMSYADIVDAIHIVQTEMGITGTTAKEASETIQGSVNSMKASWKNLVTGLGNTDADLSGLVNDFTDSLETAFGNIVPVAEQALTSMGEALPQLVGNLLPKFTQAINNLLPNLIETVGDLVTSIGNALPDITSGLVKVLPSLLESIFSNIGDIAGNLLPSLAESLGEILMNLPALLTGAVQGIVEGIGNLFSGIGDAIKTAVSDRFSDAEVFSNTFATLDTNFEYAAKDAVNNLKLAWANIIGDTDWQEAFASLSLAQDTLEKVYSEYNTFKETIAQWSPEAVQANFDIIAGKVTSYIDQISSLTDEKGNLIALENGSLAETLVKQVNDLLGKEVLTVDKNTVVQAIIEQIKVANESGEDVYEAVERFLNETYPELTRGGIDYDTLTQLSIEYNTNPQTESPEDFLRGKLEELGWDEADIETICNLLATDGEVRDAWFGTTNGAFAEAIREKANIPESVDLEAAVDLIITETENGSKVDEETIGALVDKLNELDPSVDWEKVIQLTVNGLEDVNEALEETEKLMQIDFSRKIQGAAEDRALSLRTEFNTTTTEAQKALEDFNSAIDANNQNNARTWLSALLGHRDAVTAIGASAEDAFNEWLLAEYNAEQAAKGLPQVMSIEGVDEDFIASWDGMKNAMIGFADESDGYDTIIGDIFKTILDTSDGVADNMGGLVEDVAEYFTLFAQTADSWDDVADDMSLIGVKMSDMQSLYKDYVDAYNQGLVSDDSIAEWLTNIDYADGLVEAFGGNVYNLADFLLALIENENLAKDATGEMGTSMSEAGDSASALSDGISDAVDEVGNSASEMGDATREVVQAAEDELDKAPPKFGEYGRVMANSVNGSMLNEKDNFITTASTFVTAGIASMVQTIADRQGDVETSVSDLETGMETEIDPVKDAMSDAGDTSASNLDSSFGAWAVTVEKTVTGMYNLFQTILGHALPNDMTIWGTTIGENFDSGFASGGSSAGSTAEGIAQAVIGGLNWLYNPMYGAGENAGAGFYNGLSSWGWYISNRAWDIANSVVQATNAALRSRSPSRAMMEAGGYAGEGLLIGLSEWEDPVKQEAEDIANGILGAFDDDYSAELGLDNVQNTIDASVTSAGNQQAMLYNLLMEYLPQLANMQVVIDGDKEVGALMPKIDRALANADIMTDRGNAIYA